MACTYSLNINNQVMQFSDGGNNYADLFDFLIQHKNQISQGLISDIVLSQDTKVAEMAAKIDTIRSEAKLKRREIDPVSGSVSFKAEGANMSVTDFLETATITKDSEATFLGQPFNINNWKNLTVNKMVAEDKIPRQEAEEKVTSTIELWNSIAEAGVDLHAVIGDFFAGHLTVGQTITKNPNLSEDAIKSMYKNLEGFKTDLYKKHGRDAKMIPQLSVDAETMDGTNLVGVIDLLVIDNSGQPHIYLFKSSAKVSSDWEAAKDTKYDYQLAFYRQMLATKGIPCALMDLNIVPMKLSGLEDGELNAVDFEAIQNRVKGSGENRLAWGSGTFFNNVSYSIPVRITDESINNPIREQVLDTMSKFFPNPNLKVLRDEVDIDAFIASKVFDSPNPTEGRWYFKDAYNKNNPVFIKEDSPKERNAELRIAVEKYLAKVAQNHSQKTQKFMFDLDRALKKYITLEEVTPSVGLKTSAFVVTAFQQYVNDPGWEIVKSEALNNLGIIAIQNTITKQIDFIGLSYHDLDAPLKLSLGTTLLGEHEKDTYALNNKRLLSAKSGNIELMKVMAAINEIPGVLKDVFSIGNIKILNPNTSKSTVAPRESIRETFNLLAKQTKVTNNISSLTFMDELDVLRSEFMTLMSRPASRLTSDSRGSLNTIGKDLMAANALSKEELCNRLRSMLKQLEQAFPNILKNASAEDLIAANSNTGIERFYSSIATAIAYYEGVVFVQSEKLAKYSSKDAILSGGMLTNPELIPESNIRQVVYLVKSAFDKVTRELTSFHANFFNSKVKDYWKAKGYSNARNLTLGDQTLIYSNLYRRNADGSLNNNMLFADPYDSTSPLSTEERTFLKAALWEINKSRFNLYNVPETAESVNQLKKQEKWFWVPLMETNNQILQTGIAKWVGQETRDLTTKVKSALHRSQDDAYTDAEYSEKSELITRYEMYNRFNMSEASEESRAALLTEYDKGFWEQNVEALVTTYRFAALRKAAFDRVLPAIKGVRINALIYEEATGANLTVMKETLDNYLKIAVFNQSIISEEGKEMYKYLSPLKSAATFALLGFNVTGAARDMLDGMWKASSIAFSKMYYSGEQFNQKELLQAGMIMMKEGADFSANHRKIEALNYRIRLADMDMSKLSQRLVSNNSGFANLSKAVYWCSTAPDYYHRMSMFIAKCLHDGTWDAISIGEDGVKYDWKKDKRFTNYAAGNKSHPEYNAERGRYLSMMNTFNSEEGTTLKEGDALPFAYVQKEVLAVKTLSDLVFGYYDHDARAQAEKVFMGALMLQFKTFLSVPRNAYLLKPGNYGLAKRTQAKDSNGDLLWYKEITGEDGATKTIVTTENTGMVVDTWEDRYLEGIFYTLKDCFNELRKGGGLKGFRDNIWNEETGVKKSNLKKLAHDLMFWLIMGALGTYLIKLWGDWREEDRDPLNPTMSRAFEDTIFSLFQRGYENSFGDITPAHTIFNLFNNSEPVSIGYASSFFKNTYQFVTGDKSLASYFTSTSGVGRVFKGATTELKNMSKLAEDIAADIPTE